MRINGDCESSKPFFSLIGVLIHSLTTFLMRLP